MGVPITFLDNWCPQQFELLDFLNNPRDTQIGGRRKCAPVVIRRRKAE